MVYASTLEVSNHRYRSDIDIRCEYGAFRSLDMNWEIYPLRFLIDERQSIFLLWGGSKSIFGIAMYAVYGIWYTPILRFVYPRD